MNTYPTIISDKSITVYYNDGPKTVHSNHRNFEEIRDLVESGKMDEALGLFSLRTTVEKFAYNKKGLQLRDDDTLTFNGRVITGQLYERIFRMINEGKDVSELETFLSNLYKNPSKTAVDELYEFLAVSNLPITADGHFLSYKRVREDYTDVHSGNINNSVGQIVNMPRNDVNDNRNETCSTGLHFCSLGYLKHFWGERLMVLKINPRDVVSIPTDYNNTKGRCSEYKVVDEIVTNDIDEFIGSLEDTSVNETYDEYDDRVDSYRDLDTGGGQIDEEYLNEEEDEWISEGWDEDEVDEYPNSHY